MISNWLGLSGKTAVVTGAASGIGAAVSRALLDQGCHVVLVDRSPTTTASDGETTIVACDVSQHHQVQELFSSIRPSSILINCAGITRDGWIGNLTPRDWQSVLDVNLSGTFWCCQEFLRQDFGQQGAAIVNVSSIVALQGNMGQTNYAASKGGVYSLTRSLAKEVAHRGVRVNCVVPGFIETPMVEAVPEKVQAKVKRTIALERFGKPQDVANLILYLASSERAGYITGEAVECSGLISL